MPSSASARNGSLSASFSNACISEGDNSPRRYFSISCLRLLIAFHTYFQIPFTVLDVAFNLVEVIARRFRDFLVAFVLQIEQADTFFLFPGQRFHALLQPVQIRFDFVAVLVMPVAARFHKEGRKFLEILSLSRSELHETVIARSHI